MRIFSWAYRKEKIRGAETNLPDFSDFARQVPKKFSGENLFRRPPPRRQKNFGQCTILGVQIFFGHTKIFRQSYKFSPYYDIFQKIDRICPIFFYITPILPDCRANIARLALFAQQTGGGGGAGAANAPPPGTPMNILI